MRYIEFPSEKEILKMKLTSKSDDIEYNKERGYIQFNRESNIKLNLVSKYSNKDGSTTEDSVKMTISDLYNMDLQGACLILNCMVYKEFVKIVNLGDLFYNSIDYLFRFLDIANKEPLSNELQEKSMNKAFHLDKYAIIDDRLLYYNYNFVGYMERSSICYISKSGDSILLYNTVSLARENTVDRSFCITVQLKPIVKGVVQPVTFIEIRSKIDDTYLALYSNRHLLDNIFKSLI